MGILVGQGGSVRGNGQDQEVEVEEDARGPWKRASVATRTTEQTLRTRKVMNIAVTDVAVLTSIPSSLPSFTSQ